MELRVCETIIGAIARIRTKMKFVKSQIKNLISRGLT